MKPEILAPAGDFEKLKYAIAYGADAVYMAGKEFGMRKAANNFSNEEFHKAVQYAHDRDAKVYITANILAHNEMMPKVPEYFEFLADAKVDSIIIGDIGLLPYAKKYAPNTDIHISTQTSIVNYEAARMWHELGAKRVVLARELNFEEIAEIRAKTSSDLELEAFVHGAMCMSYSGRCLISNYLTGRDANQGECAQPCRWKYSVVEETRPNEFMPIEQDEYGTYLFNSKDLCTIDYIPDLVKAGIDSFKIEGRAKTAYYAAGITSAYKKALNTYLADPENYVLPQASKDEIMKVSHRNYFTGFYHGRQDNSEFYEDSHYIREWDIIGLLVSCDDEGNAVFTQKNRFYKGDGVELVQPNMEPFAFEIDEMKNEKDEIIEVAQHATMIFKIKLPFKANEFTILRRPRKQD
ncbi:MAG: U32 family peptidase [Clostridia bacterium]